MAFWIFIFSLLLSFFTLFLLEKKFEIYKKRYRKGLSYVNSNGKGLTAAEQRGKLSRYLFSVRIIYFSLFVILCVGFFQLLFELTFLLWRA